MLYVETGASGKIEQEMRESKYFFPLIYRYLLETRSHALFVFFHNLSSKPTLDVQVTYPLLFWGITVVRGQKTNLG